MNSRIEITLTPEEAFDTDLFQKIIDKRYSGEGTMGSKFQIIRRSIDARRKIPVVKLVGQWVRQSEILDVNFHQYKQVENSKPIIIIGAGPAGLFAALRLIETGLKPIVLERGKNVQDRRRDIANINKMDIVNPESNYCFGEGGAGTYSDGKLYTRSSKRGDMHKILKIFVAHGAPHDIIYDAHPHIGTNKLPQVVQQIRESILRFGGEIRFNTKVTDILLAEQKIEGVITDSGEKIRGNAVILATGHSARDIFQLLYRRKIYLEFKPFAVGVRVEHPQILIDQSQYHCADQRDPYLPASAYTLIHQVKINSQLRSVFSFCMCPGGFMVPSTTTNSEIVLNGMSPSRRDSHFANSGIVVPIEKNDLQDFKKYGPLAGMEFQKEMEQKACALSGHGQSAPAQRLADFVDRKISITLPQSTYQPGLVSSDVANIFPEFVASTLQAGFRHFGKKIRGYLTNEAVVVAVESRTSSPIRIPRHKDTLEHPQVKHLYPCGEGAGYAGGIMSAAMDGIHCAEAIARKMNVLL